MVFPLFHRFARFVIVAATLIPAAGWACSRPIGPGNFELVRQAELIVIAQVDSGPEGSIPDAERMDQAVRIGPMQVLKGVLPKEPLTLWGMVSSRRDGIAFESRPTPLTAPHPSVLSGACFRQHYAKGGLILAILAENGRGLHPIGAFTRTVEDIESYDSLWVRTVRRYIEIQQRARDGNLREAVIAERDQLRARGPDMEAQAVADDLDDWLERASGGWLNATGWRYDDDFDQVTVFAEGAVQGDRASLSCRRNGAAIALAVSTKRKRLALTIGDRSFATDNGRISFTPELRKLLRQSAGPFAIAVDGRQTYQGRASDIFQKFAMRCEILLAP